MGLTNWWRGRRTDRLAVFDRVRLSVLLFLVLLLLGRVLFPQFVAIDGVGVLLIVTVALLALAPSLLSAKLPGGTEFQFRPGGIEQKIDAAEQIGSSVQAQMYRDGYVESKKLQLAFIEVTDKMREKVVSDPASVLVELKENMAEALALAARKVSYKRDRMPPERPEQLIEYIGKYAAAWKDQIALMRVIWDVSTSALLSGQVGPADAFRVLAVADTLNESFVMGYSLDMRPNPDWEEEGAICEYQHCIENMPLPTVTKSQHIEWRESIREALEAGRYDDHPERKAEFAVMLESPVPDLPEAEPDREGSCPVFGHFCPGGPSTVAQCDTAHDWLVEVSKAQAAKPTGQQLG